MPLNSETLPTHSRREFCLALKTARERKGITLDQIAESTKIPAYLFEGLERNDLSRWPEGLFKRSFFRDYARSIGLPVTEACADFVRLFLNDEAAAVTPAAGPAAVAGPASEASGVRLALDEAWHGPRASAISRLLAALIDCAAVILVSVALAWLAGLGVLATTAIVALAYFSLATAVLGESPARLALSRGRSIVDAIRLAPAAITAAWRHSVHAVSHMFASDDDRTSQPEGEPGVRAWVTDARRVGAPRLRVRIKLPH